GSFISVACPGRCGSPRLGAGPPLLFPLKIPKRPARLPVSFNMGRFYRNRLLVLLLLPQASVLSSGIDLDATGDDLHAIIQPWVEGGVPPDFETIDGHLDTLAYSTEIDRARQLYQQSLLQLDGGLPWLETGEIR